MDVIDYGRSYIVGQWPENSARFLVESRLRITENGGTTDFYQCASCKSERTFAEKDLFSQVNYDFLPVFGPQEGIVFRRHAGTQPRYKEKRPSANMWGPQEYRLVPAKATTALSTPAAIRDATHAAIPLVGRTEIRSQSRSAIIEYPIKTMNIHEERDLYQVDTGPVLWPDLSFPGAAIDALYLAFVAFNRDDIAYFVIEGPTTIPADSGSATVHHYSRHEKQQAHNSLFAVGE